MASTAKGVRHRRLASGTGSRFEHQPERGGTSMDGTVRGYIDEHSGEFFAALKQWLTIPSISADPARSGDVRESARWLADHLHQAGFPVAEVWETGTPDRPGLPAVFAEWPAADPGAR